MRRQEAVGLDLVDLRSNPKLPSYGRFGGVFVRFGKASRGSSPKRRVVLTVPEMDWIVQVFESYLEEVRPCFRAGRHPALWVTERCGRLSRRAANEAFVAARDAAGLPQELDLHSLRQTLRHTPDRIRLPGALRARPSRTFLCEHHVDL